MTERHPRTDLEFSALFPPDERAMCLCLRHLFNNVSTKVADLHPDDSIGIWMDRLDSLDRVEWIMVAEEEFSTGLPEDATFREWVQILLKNSRHPDDDDRMWPPGGPPFATT